jgi:hypothetical protein
VERWSGGAVERWSGGAVERWSGGVVTRSLLGRGGEAVSGDFVFQRVLKADQLADVSVVAGIGVTFFAEKELVQLMMRVWDVCLDGRAYDQAGALEARARKLDQTGFGTDPSAFAVAQA